MEFLGSTKTHAWVTPKNITPFFMRKPNTMKTKKSPLLKKSYLVAMEEAERILHLSCEARLQICTFKTIEDISKAKERGTIR